jgi:Effector-associated domain 1
VAFLRLEGPQLLGLRDWLRAAFTEEAFTELLLALDRKVEDFAGRNDTFPTVILKTVQCANAQLWWRDLLREACNAVPDPQLLQFSTEFGKSRCRTCCPKNCSLARDCGP